VPALPSVRQLRYFVALAENLHFRKAAEAIYVTQPTLSAGIKELESTLGIALFERDKTKVRLTGAGAAVLDRARGIVAAAQDLVEVAHGLGEPLAGSYRLGAIPTIAPFMLPAILAPLRSKYPKLELYLREDLTARLIDALATGELDAVLIALPYDTGDLVLHELSRDEFWFVGREGDPVLRDEKVAIADVPTDRLLLLEEGHCLRDQTVAACGERDVRTRRGLEATSLFTLIQMVEGGLGVTLLPEMAIKAGVLKGTRLVARPLAFNPKSGKPASRTVVLATRASSARRAEFDQFAEFVADRVRDPGAPRPGSPAAIKKAAK
jgi:LysR family transcriptional regulator, hydrogen peroxide-inducible genes activator